MLGTQKITKVNFQHLTHLYQATQCDPFNLFMFHLLEKVTWTWIQSYHKISKGRIWLDMEKKTEVTHWLIWYPTLLSLLWMTKIGHYHPLRSPAPLRRRCWGRIPFLSWMATFGVHRYSPPPFKGLGGIPFIMMEFSWSPWIIHI